MLRIQALQLAALRWQPAVPQHLSMSCAPVDTASCATLQQQLADWDKAAVCPTDCITSLVSEMLACGLDQTSSTAGVTKFCLLLSKPCCYCSLTSLVPPAVTKVVLHTEPTSPA
jgi:hypothetical protein